MSDDLSSLVYEQAPVPMLIVDDDVRVQSANRAAIELIGKPLDKALNARAGSLFGCLNSFDDARGCGFGPICKDCKVRGSVNMTLATGQGLRRVEAGIPVAVGEKQMSLSFLVSTAKLERDGQSLVLLCLEDITDLKTCQESLKRGADHLRVLSSILRHDIRGNLTTVSASIELTKRKLEKTLDDQDRKRLEKASMMVLKTAGLLDRMKEFEEVVTGGTALRPVDLREVVESVLEKYDLTSRIVGQGSALADDSLASALDNIVANAVNHGHADSLEVSISEDQELTQLRIADNGTGIDESIKSKVFEKGFTTGGADHQGIGLYIAKAVVEQYGGSIRVEDNKPKGAAFVLKLRKPKKTSP